MPDAAQVLNWPSVNGAKMTKNLCFSVSYLGDFVEDKKCESEHLRRDQLNKETSRQCIGWEQCSERGNRGFGGQMEYVGGSGCYQAGSPYAGKVELGRLGVH